MAFDKQSGRKVQRCPSSGPFY